MTGTQPVSAESIVVVGTSATASSVMSQLAAAGPGTPGSSRFRVVGVVLADAGDAGLGAHPSAPVLGSIDDLPDICRHLGVRTALVSLPRVMSRALSRVRTKLAQAGVAERFLPTIDDALTDTNSGAHAGAPAIDLATLIGRTARALDERRVRALLEGRRVLITGAGGSIGSELARRCAAFNPQVLILMDRAENPLFEIDRQIKAQFASVERKTVLHDVVDADATLRRMVALRPQVVFHAAAHKHVPMMEDHPSAAVSNNLFGTKSVADAALAVGAERFVMVSTDKAVNPTSVMGATKRLAELYVRSLNQPGAPRASTRFSLVRFGNVLGSACSVLPVWSSQIAEGGPVTVTHPAMTRYFMSIPEAASLVIHAATIDHGGADVFVLDMGEPVLIRGLAERFVKAHGLSPRWEDPHGLTSDIPSNAALATEPNSIRVLFTGARPGEKLHEELVYQAEELQSTGVPGILAWSGNQPEMGMVSRMVHEMSLVRHIETPDIVLRALGAHVPGIGGVKARADAA